jgi:fimbrial chaperone protein
MDLGSHRPVSSFLATLLLAGFAVAIASAAGPSGTVLISPKRVVFSGRARSAEVNLANPGETPVTYRIELVERRMLADGQLEPLPEGVTGDRSARALLSYSPHQVTVMPQSSQTVRLLLRKPADLPPGEYRSHLLCRAIPPANSRSGAASDPTAQQLHIQLFVNPGVAIPVIVRQGADLTTKVRLTDLVLVPGAGPKAPATLTFQIHRDGPISVFGDLSLLYVAKGGTGGRSLAIQKGMAVYAEQASLTRVLRLALLPGETLRTGRLRLAFLSRPEDDGGGPSVAATADLDLP